MATAGAALFVQVVEARRPVCLDPPKEGLVDLREEGKPGLVTVNAQRDHAGLDHDPRDGDVPDGRLL